MTSSIIVKSTCPYCGVGCGVDCEPAVEQGEHTVIGDDSHPANEGKLCIKGSRLAETQPEATSHLFPRIAGERVSWQQALEHTAGGLADTIAKHGPDSVALYLSGQLLTEDYYVANKFMKGFVGTANVDTNSRLCMASAVAAHQRAFGEDVVPVDYADLDLAEVVVLVGSNAAWTHPILYQRMQAAKLKGTRFVVVDPRKTATSEIANLYLPIRPGTDVALFNGLLAHLAKRGKLDQAFIENHTNGFEQALEVAQNQAANVLEDTGLESDDLETFYEMVSSSERFITFFSQGVNQAVNGTDKANAIINVHLATGSIGKPGMGPFSITGQPNAMGGREVGGLASQLAAHMGFDDRSLDIVSRFWGTDNLARQPGLKAVDMFDKVHSGEIKAIWIMATNPVVSLPRSNRVAEALEKCPLVIVSDCVADSDTGRFADVFLPAAGWGEKDGTVTNSERCISRQRAWQPPRAEVRADWQIISDVADLMGYGDAFAYEHASEIFAEHARLSGFENNGSRLFDISYLGDINATDYDGMAPFQWPQHKPFSDQKFSTPDGRANFLPVGQPEAVNSGDTKRWVLNTGRLRDQWHTMTRTGMASQLVMHTPEPRVQIHPRDAEAEGIKDGELVVIEDGQHQARFIAEVTDDVSLGQLFASMHWAQQFAWPCRVNELMSGQTDPISGQPASKSGSVSIRSITVVSWLRITLPEPQKLQADYLDNCAFAYQIPVAGGWQIEVAFSQPQVLRDLLKQLELSADIYFQDGISGTEAAMVQANGDIVGKATLAATREALLPVVAASAEPQDLLTALSGSSAAQDTSRLICTCLEVREAQILQAIEAGYGTVEALGAELGCGTNCGSCLPEVKQLLAEMLEVQQSSAQSG